MRVAGKDVREYDLGTLRDALAVVLQKNVLFSWHHKENMRWGNKNAADEEILHACKLAQADEFVSQFPNGYDTYIERGGTNVSGGQKQRLCIARALLKKPRILILDDSTSAVDTKTDALIRIAFREDCRTPPRSSLPSVFLPCRTQISFWSWTADALSRQGNHDELVALNGIYREIFDSQTKSKEA